MTDSKECKHFETCSAPICPMDDVGIWYPDENICKVRKFQQEKWIKNQKKIAKVGSFDTGYFTKEMLNRRLFVKKGVRGIDPDKDEPRQLKKWLREHPDKPASQNQIGHFKNMGEEGDLRKKTG